MTLKGFICCAMLFVLAAPAWAQDGTMDEHFFPPELVMKHQRDIKLTPEQQLRLKIARDWDEDANDDGSWPW